MFRARAAAPGIHAKCIQKIAVLAIILQVLFPAGYMAGDLGAGWYLRICHSGLPEGVLDHHHHGADENTTTVSHDAPYCPQGDGYSASLQLLVATEFTPPPSSSTTRVTDEVARRQPFYTRHARAPPYLTVSA